MILNTKQMMERRCKTMAENMNVENEVAENVAFEEMENAEEFGNVKDFLTGVGIGVGVVAGIVAIAT